LRINQKTGSLSYEDSKGWHTEVLDDRIEQTSFNSNALIASAINQEDPLMRGKVVENVGKIPGLLKSAYDWARANPVKAYLLYIELGPSDLKKMFHLAAGPPEAPIE
jgi:hypothetical protein